MSSSPNRKKDKFTLHPLTTSIKKGARLGVGLLNGIVGDYLQENHNGLAVQMGFYVHKKPMIISKENIKTIHHHPTSKICILIHGLTNDETIWNFSNTKNENYGTFLQNDLNYTPFYVRYNTGLHISENGKQLAQLIETLVQNYPTAVDEIVIIAHSMGGLVTRSACYYAPLQNANWTDKLTKLFFLGTPHLGAPLEKFGNALSHLLKSIPNSYTNITSDLINLRSAGIKDLRYGYIIDEDWKNQHPDDLLANHKTIVPLLETVEYYLITGTITENKTALVNEWFGDIMVRKNSGTGQSKDKHHINFDLKNHQEFPGIAHLKLVDSKLIYKQIKVWATQKSTLKRTIKQNVATPYCADYFPKETSITTGKIKSALQLTSNGVIGALQKIKIIHKNNPAYKILHHIPVVNSVSKEIESIHTEISDTVINKTNHILKKLS